MHRDLTHREILTELEPVAEGCLNNHLRMSKQWQPHN